MHKCLSYDSHTQKSGFFKRPEFCTPEEENYEIYEAEDGLQALDLAEQVNPDLFLLDNMMPELDGITVCQRLRTNPKFRDRTIIILSAKSQQQDIANGKAAGANYYLTKPFSPQTRNLRRSID